MSGQVPLVPPGPVLSIDDYEPAGSRSRLESRINRRPRVELLRHREAAIARRDGCIPC